MNDLEKKEQDSRLKRVYDSTFDFTKTKYDSTIKFAKGISEGTKAKIERAIRKKAISNIKRELALSNRRLEDLDEESLKIILFDERRKLIGKIQEKSIYGLLAFLGIGLFF